MNVLNSKHVLSPSLIIDIEGFENVSDQNYMKLRQALKSFKTDILEIDEVNGDQNTLYISYYINFDLSNWAIVEKKLNIAKSSILKKLSEIYPN